MRLIDADNLKPDTKTFTSAYSEELTEFYSQKVIDNAPTVEAEPVRHGHWKYDKNAPYCSNCGEEARVITPNPCCYCPNCGAKMDRKDGDSNG